MRRSPRPPLRARTTSHEAPPPERAPRAIWGRRRAARAAGGGTLLPLLLATTLLAACADDPRPAATTATPPSSAAPARTTAPAAPADHIELQKFVLTSGVKAKDPVDDIDAAKPGQRVYGHVTIRNRTAGSKRVTLSFRVNGDERSMVDLDIEKSWSWRSWAYVTLRKEDKGELTVHVFDDHGAEMATKSIPIR